MGGGAGKHGTLLTEGSNHHLDEGGEVTAALEGKEGEWSGGEGRGGGGEGRGGEGRDSIRFGDDRN